MAERLWRLGADRPETERVFTSALGRALQRKNVHNRVLAPAHERAALPWVSFHTFRHTCASLLFDHGRNVAQVAAWLGHAGAAFPTHYVHLRDERSGDALFMDRAFDSLDPRAEARLLMTDKIGRAS